MEIHLTDPLLTADASAHERFRVACFAAIAFVTMLVLVHVLGAAFGLDLLRFGVHPRDLAGLPGILSAPLIHGDYAHLASNAAPLVVVGVAMMYLYPTSSPIVLPAIYFGPGIAVWLFGRDASHIGASGLVYGLVSYVFVAGMLRRDRRAIAASMLVAFMYGALVWGVLPIRIGVSWETHLAAAVIGVVLALALRKRDVPPRKQYSWEIEPDVPEYSTEHLTRGTSADFDYR